MQTITSDAGPDPAPEHDPAQDHDWRQAGEAWGHAPADWACLFEHYATEAVAAMFDRTGVGPGVDHLDVACGSGYAARWSAGTGATVAGIDAAEPLVAIARDRLPDADLRVGSMFELPWADASFDVVTSVNGIWGGNDAALAEAHRVLRPGGAVAISFWGRGAPLDLRPVFKVFARHSPPVHVRGMKRLNDIATDGVAEAMLAAAGFTVVESGRRVSTLEWPDADLTWRALSSIGPAVPALRTGDRAAIRRDVLEAVAGCRDRLGTYRFRNDHRFVVARKPG
jgi:SAM-dependent methyltransferase